MEGIKNWDQKHKFKSLPAIWESWKVPEFTILAMLWRDDRWRLEKSKKLEEQVSCTALGTVWRYCLTHDKRQGITPDISPDVRIQAMTNMSSYTQWQICSPMHAVNVKTGEWGWKSYIKSKSTTFFSVSFVICLKWATT